jgi:PAS domain S-box-containing protein
MTKVKKPRQKLTSSKRKGNSNLLQKVDVSTLYSSIYENSLAGIFLSDLKGNFLDGNQKSWDLLGYTRKDMRKLNFASLLSDDDLKRVQKILKEVLRTGRQKKWKISR